MRFSNDRHDPPGALAAGRDRRRLRASRCESDACSWAAPLAIPQVRDPGGAACRTARHLACRSPSPPPSLSRRCGAPEPTRRDDASAALPWWIDPSELVTGALEARDVAEALLPSAEASCAENGNACMRLMLTAGAAAFALTGDAADLVLAAVVGSVATALLVAVDGGDGRGLAAGGCREYDGRPVDCGDVGAPPAPGPARPRWADTDPDADLNAHLFIKGMEARMDQDGQWRETHPFPDYTDTGKEIVRLTPPRRAC